MLEPNGPTALPSKPSEINPPADLAGLSELLKLCLIDIAFTSTYNTTFLPSICSLAAMNAEMDATEDTPLLLGTTGLKLVSSLKTATPIPSPAVITTFLTPPILALLKSTPLLLATNNAPMEKTGTMLSTTEALLTPFLELMI